MTLSDLADCDKMAFSRMPHAILIRVESKTLSPTPLLDFQGRGVDMQSCRLWCKASSVRKTCLQHRQRAD